MIIKDKVAILPENSEVSAILLPKNWLKEKVAEAKKEDPEISYVLADVTKPDDVKKYVDTCWSAMEKLTASLITPA